MNLTERMTDRSRSILAMADREAWKRAAIAIEPSHLLLALAIEGKGVAANVLRIRGVNAERIAAELPTALPSVIEPDHPLPLADSMVRAIDIARDQCLKLGHNYIGTEHLILGVVAVIEQETPSLLCQLGLSADVILRETYSLLGHLS